MIPEEIANKVSLKKIPISVQFELTWKCNQKCSHCYQYDDGKVEIPLKSAKNIINQLADAGTLYLSFTGGEPMMHGDFWDIAECAFDKHFAISVQTNGTFIDEAAARKLKELNFFSVHLSVHGSNAAVHDGITGLKGSFEKVLTAVEVLKRQGIGMVLNLTLLKENFNEWHEVEKLKEKIAPDADLRISPVVFPKNGGASCDNDLKIEEALALEFFKKKSAEGKKPPTGLLCGFGTNCCAISAKGEVYPCEAVPFVIGNLNHSSFSDIWTMSPVLKKIRGMTEKDLKECFACGLKKWCFRCSGFSYLENKKLFACSSEIKKFAKITKEVMENEKTKV